MIPKIIKTRKQKYYTSDKNNKCIYKDKDDIITNLILGNIMICKNWIQIIIIILGKNIMRTIKTIGYDQKTCDLLLLNNR